MTKGSHHTRSERWPIVLAVTLFTALLGANPARAAISPSPSSVSIFPTQTSGAVTLSLTFPAPRVEFTGEVVFRGLPADVGTLPSPVTFPVSRGQTSATVSFQYAAGPNAPPGIYTITMTAQDRATGSDMGAGTGTMTLTIRDPSFTATATPNPVGLTAGGSGETVTVSTTADPGFSDTITYSFSGFPGGISTGGSRLVTAPYPPVGFTFSAAAGAPPGTYSGTLNAVPSSGPAKTFPMTVTVAAGPDYSLGVTPGALTLTPGGASGTVQVTATGSGGFEGPVSVTVASPLPAGVTVVPSSFTLTAGGAPQTVTVTAGPSAPLGAATVTFRGTADPGIRTASLSLTIREAPAPSPDYSLDVMPGALTLVPGGPPGTTQVTATGSGGFTGSVSVTVASPLPTGVTVVPSSFTLTGGGPPQNVTLTAAHGVAPGTTVLTFRGSAGPGVREASLQLRVTAAPSFDLAVEPSSLSLEAGKETAVAISVLPVAGFSQVVQVSTPGTSGITVSPPTFPVPAGGSRTVQVQAATGALPGPRTVIFTGAASGIPSPRTVALTVEVTPPSPVITSITPSSLATGTVGNVVRLRGRNFLPGAVVTSARPGLVVEGAQVLGPELAEAVLSVRTDTPPGPYRLDLRNPDGTSTDTGGTLLVSPSEWLGAPLGVTSAAIVFPRPFTILAPGESVYPRGLLATTGMGTIVGVWLLDGIPFDRFTAVVSSGFPAEITSHVPIPTTWLGEHRLELAVQVPESVISPAVPVLFSATTASGLRIYAPRDGAVFGRIPPLLRWSMVPGASGYAVELERSAERGPGGPSAVRRLSRSDWAPDPRTLAGLGPGVHRFRVRAVFPGEVEGEPTPWRRFVVLPAAVELILLGAEEDPVTGRRLLRWQGGSPGLLYRVDFFAPEEVEPAFSALTFAQEYLLPPRRALSRYRVQVTALGPEGEDRGSSSVAPLVPPKGEAGGSAWRRSESRYLFAQGAPEVLGHAPGQGEVITERRPRIEVRWSGQVAPENVALLVDGTDVTPVSALEPHGIVHEVLLPLEPGEHRVEIYLAGKTTGWSFRVEAMEPKPPAQRAPEPGRAAEAPATDEASEAEQVPPAAPRAGRGDWVVDVLGTTTAIESDLEDPPAVTRAQVSTQFDAVRGTLGGKATADLSGRLDLESPHTTEEESRNWVTRLGTTQGSYEQETMVGYSPPSFLDRSELLTAGLARGGSQLRLGSPLGSLSYYRTFDSRPAGVVAGDFGPQQEIDAAAFETQAADGRFLFRALALRVADRPGELSPGGEGEAFGVLGELRLGAGHTLSFEAARGKLSPEEESFETAREGFAFRLGLAGTVGTLGYGLTLRQTEADFVNPANRGLTPGGVPDRTGGELTLSKSFGRTSLTGQYRRIEGGASSGATLPDTVEDGGSLSLYTQLGERVSLSVGGSFTGQRGDADDEIGLPRTDRRQTGFDLTLSESFGRLYFSQSFGWQDLSDDVNPQSDQEVTTATLSANGTFGQSFSIGAVLSGTRTEGPALGRNDQILASLQPAWNLPGLWLSLTPRAAYSRSDGDLLDGATETEQYQLLVQWSPPWKGSLLGVQVGADWDRTKTPFDVETPDLNERYVATLTLKWGASGGNLGEPAAPPSPAALSPPAAPSGASI